MEPAMSDENLGQIGDYQVLSVLGVGGMGKVFKVRNVISDRIEAMKVLLPDLSGQKELADRFLREIKILAGLNHPNIAALRTALTLDNRLVMIMEYVEGTTLAARVAAGPVAPAQALDYIDQVLSALSYAHKMHIIHRDIKPSNMMLTPQGVIKIMDFGIARSGNDPGLTMAGTTLGSLYYMSPEQVQGLPADERSDLYSVGVSLYELVTGQRPFQAHSDYSIMAAHMQEIPKPPMDVMASLPQALNDLVLVAMAKKPEERFQTADAFRNALKGVKGSLPWTNSAAQDGGMSATAYGAGAITAPASQMPTQPQIPQATRPAMNMATMPANVVPPPGSNMADIPPMPPRPASHRGLYMTLGALIVLAGLVIAGIYVPRHNRANVNAETATTQTSTTTPATTPTDTQTANPSGTDTNAISSTDTTNNATTSLSPANDNTPITDSKTPHRKVASSGSSINGQSASAAQEAAAANAQAKADEAALDALETDVDHLGGRAASIDASINTMQRQQQAQGLNMRGDMVSAQQRMQTYITKAQQALKDKDIKRAKKFIDLATPEVETLEKFLGR
jgi:serine/threonine-protein kinase